MRPLYLLMLLLFLCGTMLPAETAAPSGDPAGLSDRSDPYALLAAGKAAVARYDSDHTIYAGAIVDAAVAFECAHRAASGSIDDTLVVEIQSHLFWCKKQMDATAMQQYRARVDSLPIALPMAASPQPKATTTTSTKPAMTPSAPTTVVRPGKAVDQQILALWVQRLRERIQAEIKAGRDPRFALSSMKATAIIRELRADGGMTLAIDGGELSYPWRLISEHDQAAIAADMARGEDPAGHALAAFFHMLAGNDSAGRSSLLRSGAMAAEVERSFQITASH